MVYWEKANHSWSADSTRFINTPSQKCQDLFYYYQEMGHFKASRPYYTERANLPSYLMKFTLAGEGSLVYDGKTYPLKIGDVFFIDCQNYQYYQTESPEPWEMVWVHLYGGKTKAFYEEYLRSGHQVFHTQGNPRENRLYLIMQQLFYLQQKKNAQTDFEISILLHELLNELLLQKFDLNFKEEEIPSYVLQMKNFLETNFRQNITLEDLEKRYHLNKYQLNKDFSRYIGTPPINYLISQKISYSKDLLRYSQHSIKEIAAEVGMENFAYFSRLFKKRTGLSPSSYRQIG